MYSKRMNTDTAKLGCVKAATEVLGDKWTPQLLRVFLNNNTVRFCSLQDSVGGINPRTLSARLSHLEDLHIISRTHPDGSSRCEYKLTRKGEGLLPIMRSMEEWSRHFA